MGVVRISNDAERLLRQRSIDTNEPLSVVVDRMVAESYERQRLQDTTAIAPPDPPKAKKKAKAPKKNIWKCEWCGKNVDLTGKKKGTTVTCPHCGMMEVEVG